ncbi:MAG TPA: thioesterase [Porticoccaceae bacterium]|nr:thioesterase [Porticoccaceae bacterium]
MEQAAEVKRDDYHYFLTLATRWMDNDSYGHVNNVTYYSYFDTVTNHYLVKHGDLNIQTSPIVGFVVASSCEYVAPISFPDVIDAALRVDRLGNSSVQYGVAIFKEGQSQAAAYGTFTHVFVERETNQSVLIPPTLRAALMSLID